MSMSDDNNFLIHFGIKGMHWGIRRFQNEDGSLTSAGRARYDDSDGSPEKKTSESKPLEKKKTSEMTDQELRERINRLNMEKQYQMLLEETSSKKIKQIQPNNGGGGKSNKNSAFNKIFVATAVVVASNVMRNKYQGIADNMLKKSAENKIKNEAAAAARQAAAKAAADARRATSAAAMAARKQRMNNLKRMFLSSINPVDITLRKD